MDHFKVEHFERTHPGLCFPPFATVRRTDDLRGRIAARLGQEEAGGRRLLRAIRDRSRVLPEWDAGAPGFELLRLFQAVGIRGETIYLNWGHLDEVDRMAASDLAACWDDVWYPSADDVDIFDENVNAIILIDHAGEVRACAFAGPETHPR